jgi:hypothetical protein
MHLILLAFKIEIATPACRNACFHEAAPAKAGTSLSLLAMTPRDGNLFMMFTIVESSKKWKNVSSLLRIGKKKY